MMINNLKDSSFDDWLYDENINHEVTAIAVKRIIAWQISESMKAQHITKATLAQRMNVSRVTLDRLLKGDDTSLTLATLSNVADTLGKKLKIELVDDLAMA
ncbi:Fis family transcriptional regulator [Enhydrobacter sp. H5]|jgi:antitoxin HicB|nr:MULTISPECIES: helix-turn-helix transcriptional regulator [Pseudomonadota]ATQ84450.1 Fis family transcriptional regulator [Moraxella osloensis]NOX77667.1 XRE family transcriptional regulator [Gammaproteobacteria bacterium]ONG39024.1 Fis family transcriptional regulator [Enhydrobacter sp. H5]